MREVQEKGRPGPRARRWGIVLGAIAVSHWLADVLLRTDLPLPRAHLTGVSWLWSYPWFTAACEAGLLLAGVLLYRRAALKKAGLDNAAARTAELRRIERNLHDGTQARLVALGISIGLAEHLLKDRPEAALELLVEARKASTDALAELRCLVRGTDLPVLAEHGLDAAIRALVRALPLPVDMEIDLPERPDPPVESAAYFAVAEAMANIVKHSHATRAWLRLRYTGGRLGIQIGDNGRGGATPSAGTGLRGVQQRLAPLGGTLLITSPPDGPTLVCVDIPCGPPITRRTESASVGRRRSRAVL
ncbi:sensor histidine kinase [Actinomadura rudentiformis]|nr:histidine kinase [Actinomadura rudentiformis]